MGSTLSAPAGSVDLRPARPAVEQFLLEVYASTREAELALTDWTPAHKEQFARMQGEAAERHYREHYPGAEFDVVLVDGQPAGRLYLWRTEEEIRVVDIALLPDYRGRGVGTALLRDLLEESDRTGKPVRLHVEKFSPALQFYLRLGFVELDDRGVYWFLERKPAT